MIELKNVNRFTDEYIEYVASIHQFIRPGLILPAIKIPILIRAMLPKGYRLYSGKIDEIGKAEEQKKEEKIIILPAEAIKEIGNDYILYDIQKVLPEIIKNIRIKQIKLEDIKAYTPPGYVLKKQDGFLKLGFLTDGRILLPGFFIIGTIISMLWKRKES